MALRVLWPITRFPGGQEIEVEVLGPGIEAVFCQGLETITDAIWQSCDAIVGGPDLPDAIIEKAVRCCINVRPAVGYDAVDIARWGRHGVPVCNTPDYGTQEVADHAIALLLALVRGTALHDRALRRDPQGNWRPHEQPLARRLSTCTLGIVGLGRIGTAVALRARAFDIDVVCHDPLQPSGIELAFGIRRVDSLAELARQSDIVSLHAPLSAATRNLIDAAFFAAAKPGMVLINTARGALVDLVALEAAMRDGRVRAAGLDVLPEEPINLDVPLLRDWQANVPWLRERLLLTPHSAFYTPESARDMRAKAARTAARYLRDGRLENCVNGEFLVNVRKRWLG